MHPIAETLAAYESFFATLVAIVSLVSIPIFLFRYWQNGHREQAERDRAVFESLDQPYTDYLNFTLLYPDLDAGEFPLKTPPTLSEPDRIRLNIIFSILTSLFERAFVLYAGASSKARRDQWKGWDDYIGHFCSRKNYREFVQDSIGLYEVAGAAKTLTFDANFERYLAKKISTSFTD